MYSFLLSVCNQRENWSKLLPSITLYKMLMNRHWSKLLPSITLYKMLMNRHDRTQLKVEKKDMYISHWFILTNLQLCILK